MEPNHDFSYHLVSAWSAWFHGRLAVTDTLFYVSILWWGRFGLVAQFAGSILLLWEGASSRWFNRLVLWMKASYQWANRRGDDPITLENVVPPRGASFFLDAFLMTVFFLPVGIMTWLTFFKPKSPFILWLNDDSRSNFGAIMLCLALIVIWLGGSAAVSFAGIYVFGWLAENLPSFPARLRIPAVALLAVGFHFALLAS